MMPLCSRMRPALISGITSGTFGSIRKADELSTTTAPAFTAIGANFREMPPPAENSAMSTPWKEFSVSSSITICWPRKSMVLPAERALASAFSLPTRKSALVHGGDEFGADGAGHAGNGHNGIVLHFGLHSFAIVQAIKKPRTFSGGASVQMMRSFDYARTPPEPGGLGGFRRCVWWSCSWRGLMREILAGVNGFRTENRPQPRLNRAPLSRHKLTHEPSQSFRSARDRRRRRAPAG